MNGEPPRNRVKTHIIENKAVYSYIDDIKTNLNFTQKIIYNLTLIKQYICSNDTHNNTSTLNNIIDYKILEILGASIAMNKSNEFFLNNITDFLSEISNKINRETPVSCNKIAIFCLNIMNEIPCSLSNVYQTFSSLYLRLLEHLNFNHDNIKNDINTLITYIDNNREYDSLVIINIQVIIEVIYHIESFEDFDQRLVVISYSIWTIQTNEEVICKIMDLLWFMVKKSAFTLKYWREHQGFREVFKKVNSLSSSGLIISGCTICSYIANEKDIKDYIYLLTFATFVEYTNSSSNNNEITDESIFIKYKENMTRIIIFLSQEKQYNTILENEELFNCFIILLSRDIDYIGSLLQDKRDSFVLQNIQPILKLIINIARKNNYIIKNPPRTLLLSLLKLMKLYFNNIEILEEIIDITFNLIKTDINALKTVCPQFEQNELIETFLLIMGAEQYFKSRKFLEFLSFIPMFTLFPELNLNKNYSINEINNTIIFNLILVEFNHQLESISLIYSEEKINALYLTWQRLSLFWIIGNSYDKITNIITNKMFNSNSFQLFYNSTISWLSNHFEKYLHSHQLLRGIIHYILNGFDNWWFCESKVVFDNKWKIMKLWFIKWVNNEKEIHKTVKEFVLVRIMRGIDNEKWSIFYKEILSLENVVQFITDCFGSVGENKCLIEWLAQLINTKENGKYVNINIILKTRVIWKIIDHISTNNEETYTCYKEGLDNIMTIISNVGWKESLFFYRENNNISELLALTIQTFLIKNSENKIGNALFLLFHQYVKQVLAASEYTNLNNKNEFITYILSQLNLFLSKPWDDMSLLIVDNWLSIIALFIKTPSTFISILSQDLIGILIIILDKIQNKSSLIEGKALELFSSVWIIIYTITKENVNTINYPNYPCLIQNFLNFIASNYASLNSNLLIYEIFQVLIINSTAVSNTENRFVTDSYLQCLRKQLENNYDINNDFIISSLSSCKTLLNIPNSDLDKLIQEKEQAKNIYVWNLWNNITKSWESNSERKSYRSSKVKSELNRLSNANGKCDNDKEENNVDLDIDKSFNRWGSSSLNINSNPKLKFQFDRISFKFNVIATDLIEGKAVKDDTEISQWIELIKLFGNDEENINNLYENGIIRNWILICKHNQIATYIKQYYECIIHLSENNIFNKKLADDINQWKYFFDGWTEMSNNSNIRNKIHSDWETEKLVMISKVISYTDINVNTCWLYLNKINEVILLLEPCWEYKIICLNWLSILLNIFSNDIFEDIKTGYNSDKLSMWLNSIWNRYHKDTTIMVTVIRIFECTTATAWSNNNNNNNNIIITNWVQLDIINKWSLLMIENKEESSIIKNSFLLIINLLNQPSLLELFQESKTIDIIISNAEHYISETTIVENFLNIINTIIKQKEDFFERLMEKKMNKIMRKIFIKYLPTANTDLINLCLELIIKLWIIESNVTYYCQSENLELLINAWQKNIMIKEKVFIPLKFIGVLLGKYSSIAHKYPSQLEYLNLMVVLDKIKKKYFDSMEIFFQILEIIKALYYCVGTDDNKKIWIILLFKDYDWLVKDKKIEYIAWLIQVYKDMIIMLQDNSITNDDSICLAMFLGFINNVSEKWDINAQMIIENWRWLRIIISKLKVKLKGVAMKEICKLLHRIEEYKQWHIMIVVYSYTKTWSLVCETQNPTEGFSVSNLDFVFLYIIANTPTNNESEKQHIFDILKYWKTWSQYLRCQNDDNTWNENTISYILQVFTRYESTYWTEPMYLIHILQIISNIAIKSKDIKKKFYNEGKKICLIDKLTSIKKNTSTNQLLEYQARCCLLNWKVFETCIITSQKLKSKESRWHWMEISAELQTFVQEENIAKYYTITGDVIKVIIKVSKENCDYLTKIWLWRPEEKDEIIEEMSVIEMESCVRSASSAAFKKGTGFFSKKPKAEKCFSIFGVKCLDKAQKSWSLECREENTCIKYVDYISSMINNANIMRMDCDNCENNNKEM